MLLISHSLTLEEFNTTVVYKLNKYLYVLEKQLAVKVKNYLESRHTTQVYLLSFVDKIKDFYKYINNIFDNKLDFYWFFSSVCKFYPLPSNMREELYNRLLKTYPKFLHMFCGEFYKISLMLKIKIDVYIGTNYSEHMDNIIIPTQKQLNQFLDRLFQDVLEYVFNKYISYECDNFIKDSMDDNSKEILNAILLHMDACNIQEKQILYNKLHLKFDALLLATKTGVDNIKVYLLRGLKGLLFFPHIKQIMMEDINNTHIPINNFQNLLIKIFELIEPTGGTSIYVDYDKITDKTITNLELIENLMSMNILQFLWKRLNIIYRQYLDNEFIHQKLEPALQTFMTLFDPTKPT